MNTVSFFITSIIIILIPGTGVTYTISTGLTRGKKAAVVAALGCTLGIIPHLCASIALSSILLRLDNKAFFVIKLFGVIYLIYLGVGMLRSKSQFHTQGINVKESVGKIIRTAILINLLNPKLTLFFFSFLPQYAKKTSEDYMLECMYYGILFMILSLLIFMAYALLAGLFNKFFANTPKRMVALEKIFGGIFIILAILAIR